MHTYELQVRFSECDGLGHVNNTVYFVYMEEARTELFRLFNPTLAMDKWNVIVASTKCDFRKPSRYAEKLTVTTRLSRLGNSSFTVDQSISNSQGETVAEGQTVLVHYDYAAQCSVPIPESVREKMKALMK